MEIISNVKIISKYPELNKLIECCFTETGEKIEDLENMDFKAKVYLFYYMWIWQLIDFLDLDGIKRIQLVEDNKNFLYVPNRVSEVLFADWLQNKVLPKIESKFILQIVNKNDYYYLNFGNKYLIKKSLATILGQAYKQQPQIYIKKAKLEVIFRFDKNNDFKNDIEFMFEIIVKTAEK
uniref:Uncharacterized protein n=1 Tax=Meloidogyne enterolobii TaxID=390850 RepID=A0A6V7V4N3_MELEN|nr:unnamed protein product [Meloidogyne enterolobii]